MRISARSSSLFGLVTLLATAQPINAQLPDTTPGYPIQDAAVVASCKSCHAQDSTGRMTRISYLRKTPEGWETSIRRMVTLNNAKIEPEAARAVLKYLANQQGLGPEEARPGRFDAERRMIDYAYPGDRRTEDTCRACHSMGRVILQRRTRDEWGLLVAMHRGFYPGVDNQGFRRGGPPGAGGDAHPMDDAIKHLGTAFPLTTADWTAWSATMRPPRIEGTWLVSGSEPGRGAFFGKVAIARAGADDAFTTEATYTFANGGARVTRSGRAVVYTGYQWRGRSAETGKQEQWREVMMVEPGWSTMSGRWFTGEYDEFGQDVTLIRASTGIALAGSHPRALRRGAGGQEIRLYGANLPGNLAPASIDFGPGVRVERVVSATPELLTLSVNVDSNAAYGERDLFLSGASLRKAIVVYDTVSRIKVTPLAGMARVGGITFPKQFQQFEAIAYHNGVDGRPDTPDDLELGPVSVTWTVEEYGATYEDDDLKFVGQLNQNGFFTPAEDGPNPKRSGNRNNIGDVWIVATHQPTRTGARALRGRAHLVVTVPLYMRWEPWRIEK
ncbi:MAG: quinohemoprotein amine dehydrogenase subunit alpha [Longimicrobiales bacterium]